MTDPIGDVLTGVGREFGMSAGDVATHLLLGERHHADAPASDCGMVDPRDDAKWCRLAPDHHGENHNRYAPQDGCRTWTACDQAGHES